MHKLIDPAILYFGTPVVLVSSLNEDGSPNVAMGYRYEPDKCGVAGLTPEPSRDVAPPRLRECPVQLEAVLESSLPLAESDPVRRGNLIALESAS